MMEVRTDLLSQYLDARTERNFRAMVGEHSAMVQATAARRLHGDIPAAQDVSQQVFIRLAKSAPKLGEVCLAGWLYRQTCRLSADYVRGESRRRAREITAADLMKKNHPSDQREQTALVEEIDEALNSLSADEQDAIVLRYLEEKSHRSVGKQLGISEEAARKRCVRAVESLRDQFTRRGLGISTAGVVLALSTLATPPLPAATIITISKSSLSKSSASLISVTTLLSFAGGLAATSLAASGVYAVKNRIPESQSPSIVQSSRPTSSQGRRGAFDLLHQREITAEVVVAELKRLYLQPRNLMTSIRLKAYFEDLPANEKLLVFKKINEQFSKYEIDFAIEGLLKIWVADDFAKAFDFIRQVRFMGKGHTNNVQIYSRLFYDWVKKDSAGAEQWLKRNWDHPDQEMGAFEEDARPGFIFYFINAAHRDEGAKAAIEKAREFGNTKYFYSNIRSLTTVSRKSLQDDNILKIYQALSDLPESAQRDRAIEKLFENWRQYDGAHLQRFLPQLHPIDTIQQSLLTLDLEEPSKKEIRFANGGRQIVAEDTKFSAREYSNLLESREEVLRETALKLGYSQTEIDQQMISYYFLKSSERVLDLLDRLPPNKKSDEVIVEGIRILCANSDRGRVDKEIMAFNAVLAISDPARQVEVARALYRRVQVKSPDIAKDMATFPDFREEISAALQQMIATETR